MVRALRAQRPGASSPRDRSTVPSFPLLLLPAHPAAARTPQRSGCTTPRTCPPRLSGCSLPRAFPCRSCTTPRSAFRHPLVLSWPRTELTRRERAAFAAYSQRGGTLLAIAPDPPAGVRSRVAEGPSSRGSHRCPRRACRTAGCATGRSPRCGAGGRPRRAGSISATLPPAAPRQSCSCTTSAASRRSPLLPHLRAPSATSACMEPGRSRRSTSRTGPAAR